MGWLKKKKDPISARAQELNSRIAALEREIQDLNAKAQAQPKVRSTAVPAGQPPAPPPPTTRDPIFETIGGAKPKNSLDASSVTSGQFNDLGVRKYDLAGAWKRLQSHFRGPTASNPKLVSYLAAGSIKGLRPMRYEKRVARNRFIVLSLFFVLLLWGILWVIFYHR